MNIEDTNIVIENIVEKKLVYRALEDLRMNDISCSKYYLVLDELIYNLKKHLYAIDGTKVLL